MSIKVTVRSLWTTIACVLLALAAAFVVLWSIVGRNDDRPIRLAYQNHIGSAVCIVAVEERFFEREGIAVEGFPFSSGPACAEAIYSGSADIGTMGDATAVITASRGGPYRILASHGQGEHRHRLVAGENAPIHSTSDLVGKALAVKKGTSAYGGLLVWLAANNVEPASIRILDMGPSEMPDALAAGSIDAFVASEPTPSFSEARGARQVATLGGLGNQYPILIMANTRLLQDRPDDVRAAMRAFQKAAEFIEENPDAAAQIVARATGLPEHLAQRVMARHVYRISLDDDIVRSLHATARFLEDEGILQAVPDLRKVCDATYLPTP
ncbi:MAG: aliphatic sulfonate ABC transporter substrate-binding protein [Thermoguttaceae bacterium]|jgi:aliphatic sulfonates family ABC transporter substrate-binding protein|nr:aliphatic sulfonate ABC transporter substrate-binding protein [Thermoguttaceae bacterium]